MLNILLAYLEFFEKKFSDFSNKHYIFFGIVQSLLFFYILLGLAYLANSYLMRKFPSLPITPATLQKIIRRYSLPPSVGGFLIAIGNSIPELTTNLLSCLSSKPEMIGFGFGAIVGSGVFAVDLTICMGIASCFSYYTHKKAVNFAAEPLLRDLSVYIFTLLYLFAIFWDLKITFWEAGLLMCFLPVYLGYIYLKGGSPAFIANMEASQQPVMMTFKPDYYHARYNIFHENNRKYFSYASALELGGDNEDYDFTSEISGDDEGHDLLEIIGDNEVPGLKANYYQQNRIFNSPITNLLEDIIEALYTPWKKLFSILPVEKSPFLTFGGIMTICFMITRYNIHTVDRIINYLSLSHTFVGLTFVSWGGNIGDIVNATVAAKNQHIELMTSSIIGSQIFNLQICLGLPWLIKTFLGGSIALTQTTMFGSIVVVVIIVLISLMVLLSFKLKLTYGLGICLVFTYCFYAGFEYVENT